MPSRIKHTVPGDEICTAIVVASSTVGGWSCNTARREADQEEHFERSLRDDIKVTEEQALFDEYHRVKNATEYFVLDKDPDLMIWYPSRQFFEKYGFELE
jgi:hypothetical protein